jgi:hypothetical protein
MTTLLAINTMRIEQTEFSYPSDNFEVGYEGDFERVLERSKQNREALAGELEKNRQELREARKELEEGLRSRREDIEAEFKKKSRLEQDYRKEQEKIAQGQEEEEKKAEKFAAERVSRRTALASLVAAGNGLPTGFKSQIGTSLMASGQAENGLNGYLLTGGGRPTSFLKGTLEKLGSLGQSWKLDKEALPELQNLFLESGVPSEEAQSLIGALSQTNLTLDDVLRTVGKADVLAAQNGGGTYQDLLTTTPGGLNNLGQFLASLGLSSEVVQAVTSMSPGQTLVSSDLKSILLQEGGGEEVLAPYLTSGNLTSLYEALKSMGAGSSTLGQLTDFISVNQGQANLNDLLGLLAFSEQPGPVASDPQKVAEQIQNLLSQTSTDSELVKAPVFNEIVLKMTLLGDRQISDDFMEMSPALQALRGGLSVWREGQNSQSGGFEQSGEKERNREERLMAQRGLTSQTLSRGLEQPLFESTLSSLAALSEETAGYAGETLARQISQKLVYSARRGIHRLKMNLSPESLGQLDVELKVKGEKLTAYIKAESLEAYEALEKEMSGLKESLSQAGLQLEMTLSYDGDSGQGQAMARSGYGQGQNSSSSNNYANDYADDYDYEQIDPLLANTNNTSFDNRLLDRVV